MTQPVLSRNFPATNAFDLKASYQRNMMTSMFAVTILSMAIACSIWVADTYFFERETRIEFIPREQSQRWDNSTLISIKSEPTTTTAAASTQSEIGIPEPVEEETPIEETVEVASAETGSGDSLLCKYLETTHGYAGGTEYFPSDTEFIVFEKTAEVVELYRPEYPRLAQKAGLTGIVWVKTLVDRHGNPRENKIGRSSGIPLLDQAALDAASRSTFTPAIQNGHPVATWVTYKVVFELENKPEVLVPHKVSFSLPSRRSGDSFRGIMDQMPSKVQSFIFAFSWILITWLFVGFVSVSAVDTEPTPPLDSTGLAQTDSTKQSDSLQTVIPVPDSMLVDSLKSDSAMIKLPLCSEGVRATIPPNFKKFGKVSFDRKIVTLTDPVISLVRCCIDVDGTVLGAEIAQSCSIPLLDDIAVSTANKHTVEPAKVIDEIVQTAAFFKVTFKLGKESRKFYGRYEIGELEFAFMGLDTTLPKLGSDASIDSMIPESLLIAAKNAEPGSKAMTSLDSARLAAKGKLEPDDTRAGGRIPKDSTRKPVASIADGKKDSKEKPGKTKPPKKEEELIPEVDAVIAVDQLAVIARAEKPSYPKEEAKNRVEGTVWIATLVDSKGRARDQKIWKSSGNAKFDQAALQAAVTFKYQAAQRDGKPIMTWLKHRIEFRLTDL